MLGQIQINMLQFIVGLVVGKVLFSPPGCEHELEENPDYDYCDQEHPDLVNHLCYRCKKCGNHVMV